jgi:hypothetical protein
MQIRGFVTAKGTRIPISPPESAYWVDRASYVLIDELGTWHLDEDGWLRRSDG